jgi:hypothetical protein
LQNAEIFGVAIFYEKPAAGRDWQAGAGARSGSFDPNQSFFWRKPDGFRLNLPARMG